MAAVSVFTQGRLVDCSATEGELLVADSWLIVDGTARFLGDHERRFRAACAPWTGDALLTAFWRATVAALPRVGRWFPRVELSSSGQLRLRVRPVPASSPRLIVRCGPAGDVRKAATTKGPDLTLLSELRAEAVRHGADEMLLRSADGSLIEGTTTSLLWWEDDDLCVPATDLPALPGVTSRRLRHRATGLGLRVIPRHITAAELTGREVWLVNALHGIRPVHRWAGAPVRPGPATRAAAWQTWLDAQRQPLPLVEPAPTETVPTDTVPTEVSPIEAGRRNGARVP